MVTVTLTPGREFFAVPPGFTAHSPGEWPPHGHGARRSSREPAGQPYPGLLVSKAFQVATPGWCSAGSGPELALSSGRCILIGLPTRPHQRLAGESSAQAGKKQGNSWFTGRW